MDKVKEGISSIREAAGKLKDKYTKDELEADLISAANKLSGQMDLNKGNHTNSKEYTKMEKAYFIVKNWNSTKVQEALKNEKNAPKSLEDAMKNLKRDAEAYSKAKNRQIRLIPSLRRQSRLAFADVLLDYATKSVKKFEERGAKKEMDSPEVKAPTKQVTEKQQEGPTAPTV